MLKSMLLIAGLSAGFGAAPAQRTANTLTDADKEFVIKAAKLNSYELKSAELAQQWAVSSEDKAYAAQIIKDHTKVGKELKAAVAKADPSVKLPTEVDPKGQKRLDELQKAGKGFDKEYKDQMIESHQEIHEFFEDYIERDKADPGVKSVISGAQPTVEMHLAAAKKLPS